MFSLRTHVWIFLGLLAAIVLLGMAGNLLAATGFQPALTEIQLPLQIVFLGLVVALALAFLPVMGKLLDGFQLPARHGDPALGKTLAPPPQAGILGLSIPM